jgi:hypothetical protein
MEKLLDEMTVKLGRDAKRTLWRWLKWMGCLPLNWYAI